MARKFVLGCVEVLRGLAVVAMHTAAVLCSVRSVRSVRAIRAANDLRRHKF